MTNCTVNIPLASIPEQPQAEPEPELLAPPPVYAPPAAAPPAYNAMILANLNNNNNNNNNVEEPAPKRRMSSRELAWFWFFCMTIGALFLIALARIAFPSNSDPAPASDDNGEGAKVKPLGMRMRGAEIEMRTVNSHAYVNVKTRAEIDADVARVNSRAEEVAAVVSAHSKDMHAYIARATDLLAAGSPTGSARRADVIGSAEVAKLAALDAYLKSIVAGQDAHLSLLSRLARSLPDDSDDEEDVVTV